MIIGIDIDDTMTNHCETWFDLYNKYFKSEEAPILKLEDAYRWNFYDEWKTVDRDNLFNALKSENYFKNIHLVDNVFDVISQIIYSGHKVIIISSTNKEFQEPKKKWLLEQLPLLTEEDIIFTVNKELINVDLMIDDNLAYAKRFKCPFLLYKQPWNTGRPQYEYSDNIINVGNWKEVEDILRNMEIIITQKGQVDDSFNEATLKLIKGIKDAKTDKECIDLLNPYIEMWQKQGILIGMQQINDATMVITEEIVKDLKNQNA